MSRAAAVLFSMMLSCASSGPPPVLVSVGPWRASYRDWSSVNLCETEPSWLREELLEVNEVLEKLDARGGAWRDDELPLLEDAARKLPPLIEAHEQTLKALQRCPGADSASQMISRGLELTGRTREQLAGAPKLVQFVRHRHALEKWRETLSTAREEAFSKACAGRDGGAAGPEPLIYFAYGDELNGTTWHFCDGAVVVAPLTGGLELTQLPETWPGARAKELKARCFELSRVYPGGRIQQPPR